MDTPLAFLLEVMDKEPSLSVVVSLFVGIGVLGLVLSRRKPLLAIPFVALALVGGLRQLSEINDPSVGPAIRNEAGASYVALTYVATALGLILPLVGAWLGRVAKSKATSPRTN